MNEDTKNLIVALKRAIKFLLKLIEKIEKGEDV